MRHGVVTLPSYAYSSSLASKQRSMPRASMKSRREMSETDIATPAANIPSAVDNAVPTKAPPIAKVKLAQDFFLLNCLSWSMSIMARSTSVASMPGKEWGSSRCRSKASDLARSITRSLSGWFLRIPRTFSETLFGYCVRSDMDLGVKDSLVTST